jgi:GT2 family glycosyltransferase
MFKKAIDIQIPFSPTNDFGIEYNRIMENSKRDWVLFLDPDIFLCHPNWYYMCQVAIEQYPDTGLFVCWTNRTQGFNRRVDIAVDNDNILDHYYESKRLFNRFRYECTEVTDSYCVGEFILVNKLLWTLVGGFPEETAEYAACDFARQLVKHLIKIRLIQGLYIYHLQGYPDGTWIEGVLSGREMMNRKECNLHG